MLRSGHHSLKAHLYRLKLVETPECDCGHPFQDTSHVLFDCPLYIIQRDTLHNDVEITYVNHDTPPYERLFNTEALVWPAHTKPETRYAITEHLAKFLMASKIKL